MISLSSACPSNSSSDYLCFLSLFSHCYSPLVIQIPQFPSLLPMLLGLLLLYSRFILFSPPVSQTIRPLAFSPTNMVVRKLLLGLARRIIGYGCGKITGIEQTTSFPSVII